MNFIRRTPRDRPYADNSTGRHRGSLKTRKGRMSVFEAKGPARQMFANEISAAIQKYLGDNSDKLQASATYVGWSLFMMGKSADQTKPVVMLVSDDKQARVEAFRLIKDSGIMEEYQGFDLGEMELKAEFENLRPLGSGPDPFAHETPLSFDYSFYLSRLHDPSSEDRLIDPQLDVPAQQFLNNPQRTAFFNLESSRFLHGYYHHAQQPAITAPPILLPRRAGKQNLASFVAPDDQVDVSGEFGVHGAVRGPSGSSAWVGGIVSYDGKFLAHTVYHFLSPLQPVVIRPRESEETETSDVECEIMGLGDSEDEDDEMADVTSRASLTPTTSDCEGSESEIGSPSESERSSAYNASFGSPAERALRHSPSLPDARRRNPVVERGPPRPAKRQPVVGTERHRVIAVSEYLDSAFIEAKIPNATAPIIPLESYKEHVEMAARDVVVRTATSRGEISGTLSGTPFFVRLPGTKDFQEVYTAKLDSALRPGDCGCWLTTSSGKLVGHVIAGSPSSGQALVMPAARVFARLLEDLTTWRSRTKPTARFASPIASHSEPRSTSSGDPSTAMSGSSGRTSSPPPGLSYTETTPPDPPEHWLQGSWYAGASAINMHSLQFGSMGPACVDPAQVNSDMVDALECEDESTFELMKATWWSPLPSRPMTPIKEEIVDYPESTVQAADSGSDEDVQLSGQKRKISADDEDDWKPNRKRGSFRPRRRQAKVPSARIAMPDKKFDNPSRLVQPEHNRTLTRPGVWLSCPEPGCPNSKQRFADQAELDAHTKKKHTRPYVCVFNFAGCESTFASKNEWKRHVNSQHLLLNYWICQEDGCGSKETNPDPPPAASARTKSISATTPPFSSRTSSSTSPPPRNNRDPPRSPNGAIFNRKDLYMQHMRRLHMSLFPRRGLEARGNRAIPGDGAEIQKREDRLRSFADNARQTRCALPEHITCPAADCGCEFNGPEAWDLRMEHVARHLDRAARGEEVRVVFGGENDVAFVAWAASEDVGIIERVGSTWALRRPAGGGGGGRLQGITGGKDREGHGFVKSLLEGDLGTDEGVLLDGEGSGDGDV
ncbi:hypothetical protein QBC34DRAFT_402051 [Podospora aff. communis PSN243]|uniref:C2H2-type domain-containing protein n=1 Tax=Podospora aff. communis PSN243 TaxID=3040156 RepID=A0AAV9GWV0_9PEZI|nr:hypothetical protein QBC34DRAFT_402051 [Podospora aff. communis PSN243]